MKINHVPAFCFTAIVITAIAILLVDLISKKHRNDQFINSLRHTETRAISNFFAREMDEMRFKIDSLEKELKHCKSK